jgi:hypothetical protein
MLSSKSTDAAGRLLKSIRCSLEQHSPEHPAMGRIIRRLKRIFFKSWDVTYEDMDDVLEDINLEKNMLKVMLKFKRHFFDIMRFKIIIAVFIWLLKIFSEGDFGDGFDWDSREYRTGAWQRMIDSECDFMNL